MNWRDSFRQKKDFDLSKCEVVSSSLHANVVFFVSFSSSPACLPFTTWREDILRHLRKPTSGSARVWKIIKALLTNQKGWVYDSDK